jgi:N-acetylmuramoyl-L-alanine amidase
MQNLIISAFRFGSFLALLLSVLAFGSDAHAADAEITDIRVGKQGLSTRIVIDVDRPIDASVFALAGPARLVVDLPEVGWRLPARPLPAKIGVLSRLRYGLFKPGNSRIVIDLNQPSMVHQALALPATANKPNRLVIDLARTSGTRFLQAVSADPLIIKSSPDQVRSAEIPRPPTNASLETPQGKKVVVTQPSKPAVKSVAAPQRKAPSAAPPGKPNPMLASIRVPAKPATRVAGQKRVIVIDPGHGGVDPGAIGVSGIYEKHITLAAARDLKEHLERTGRFKVYLTRDRDVFIRLRGRIEIARERNADLFISVHADTIRNRKIRGLSVYTLSEKASDKEAAELADRENKSDLIAGIDLSHESEEVTNILIDLAQRETMNQSARLASLLVDELKTRVKVLRNPHRFAGFAVLKAPDVPSVLIEMGFLSNRDDERALRSKSHRRKVAQSIAGAVDAYFRKIESASRP